MSNNTNKFEVPALSERDMEMLIGALRCAEGGFPKIDYKKFADMAGFKNANSASVSFLAVRRKVMGEAGPTKPAPKKSTPSKRKQATSAAADADDPDESPTKKAKTTPNKPVKKEHKVKGELEDDEGPAFL